jgi:Family of unknown function (DUF6335)
MAKRKATARTRKTARRTRKPTTRRASRSARRPMPKRTARAGARGAKSSASKRRAGAVARRKTSTKRTAPKKSRRVAARSVVTRPKPAALDRERRRLRDDETVPGAPSTLGYAPKASSAESGQAALHHRIREHTEGGPELTGGELDADWGEAYSSGEETPGGDMPTPDQDVVEEIGRALGVEYEDAEELKGSEKIEARDRHRWEYDPASAEDYKDRNRKQ